MNRTYNKLVRDNIPDFIKNNGETPRFARLLMNDNLDLIQKLLQDKLVEEALEFKELPSIDELADLCEVLDAIKTWFDVSDDEIKEARRTKSGTHGAFRDMIYLIGVE